MAGSSWSHRCRVVLATLAALGSATLVSSGPVHAQGWGFFGGLFGGGQPQPVQPPRMERRYSAPRPRVSVPRPRAEPREPETAAAKAPPANASRFVLVFGDSLGQILASGLDDSLSDRSDVAVLHDARDSTGLVREDFYNWPKVIADLVAARGKPEDKAKPGHGKIDVAVMMIGSNDRQSISEGGKAYEADSDQWTALYTRRAMTIAETLKKANIPLVWVGIPITKDDSFADDMAALNDIYRDVAAKTGATFVDTWEAFSTANGDFSTFGPDVNGQTVRLRSADGIHFTKAGARKLAHFVDAQIRRVLDQRAPLGTPLATVPGGGTQGPAAAALAGPVVKPEAGPVEVLTQTPVAANGRLDAPISGAQGGSRSDPLVETALVKGEPQAVRPGRADDATWPPH